MPHARHAEEQLRILKHIGSVIRLQAVGITKDALPEPITLQLLHLKRAERDPDK